LVDRPTGADRVSLAREVNDVDELVRDPEPLLATLAKLFADEGASREVAILVNARAQLTQVDYDNWDGGIYYHRLCLEMPLALYQQISDDRGDCETIILKQAHPLLLPFPNSYVRHVLIVPSLAPDSDWRDKARAWLVGDGVSNQGRVRSDNVAPCTYDGLLFRSQQEINLYRALKSLGVSFAPLPVFVRGGKDYRRIEPDFVILKDGIVMIVEVDGDTVHRETPAEAHDRTTMLAHEGAHVERVKASDCDTPEKAMACARRLVQVIDKLRSQR